MANTHPNYLFVYGTLLPGHGNNHVIANHGGEDLGPAKTVDKFLLSDGFPFVWSAPTLSSPFLGRIVGHLYRVSKVGLAACDRLEGHPTFYCRTNVPVVYDIDATPQYTTAGIYLAQRLPDWNGLQKPRDGLLEWGRERREQARDFQRVGGRAK